MRERIPHDVLGVCKTLRQHGFESWLVGGAVRDLVMARPVHDWDIATNARWSEVFDIFGDRVKATGVPFGTVTVVTDQRPIEVTTFREDSDYSDGRHPDFVVFSQSIEKDLMRRDFTINAMAYNPIEDVFLDNHGGMEDIQNMIVRAVGDPGKRFQEDALRMLRACRFATVLGFTIEAETLESIKRLCLGVMENVAQERITQELNKMIVGPDPSRGFRLLLSTGLLALLLPELSRCAGVTQNRWHKHDVFGHLMIACDVVDNDLDLRWAAVLHDIGKPLTRTVEGGNIFEEGAVHFYEHEIASEKMALDIMMRMKQPTDLTESVLMLIREHMSKYDRSWSNASVRRLINRVGKERVWSLWKILLADAQALETEPAVEKIKDLADLARRIEDQEMSEAAFKITDLALNGFDVMTMMLLKPGPEVGKVLDWLLEQVLEDPSLNTTERLKELLQKYPER